MLKTKNIYILLCILTILFIIFSCGQPGEKRIDNDNKSQNEGENDDLIIKNNPKSVEKIFIIGKYEILGENNEIYYTDPDLTSFQKINIFNFNEMGKIKYNNETNKLYFLSNGKLYNSNKDGSDLQEILNIDKSIIDFYIDNENDRIFYVISRFDFSHTLNNIYVTDFENSYTNIILEDIYDIIEIEYDEKNDKIFYLTYLDETFSDDPTEIWSVDVNGNNKKRIKKAINKFYKSIYIDNVNEIIYYIGGKNICKTDLNFENISIIYTSSVDIDAFVIDQKSVYFFNIDTNKIYLVEDIESNKYSEITYFKESKLIDIAFDKSSNSIFFGDQYYEKISILNNNENNKEINNLICGLIDPEEINIDSVNKKIITYGKKSLLSSPNLNKIQMFNLDGSNIEDIYVSENIINDMDIDEYRKIIFITGTGKKSNLVSIKLDASGFENLEMYDEDGKLLFIRLVRINEYEKKLYLFDYNNNLYRCDYDGNNVENLLCFIDKFDQIELNKKNKKIYFFKEYNNNQIIYNLTTNDIDNFTTGDYTYMDIDEWNDKLYFIISFGTTLDIMNINDYNEITNLNIPDYVQNKYCDFGILFKKN